MPLRTPLSSASRLPRLAPRAALGAACVTAAAFTIAVSDGHAAAPQASSAGPSQPSVSRYLDIEANKAAGMRALGLAKLGAAAPSPYGDVEANKARSQRSR